MGQTDISSIALSARLIVFMVITFPSGLQTRLNQLRPLQIAFPLVAFVSNKSFGWSDGLSTVTYDREPGTILRWTFTPANASVRPGSPGCQPQRFGVEATNFASYRAFSV